MLMRTEIFRSVGGFSPEYFMYAEDMDLCFKILRAGYRIYHVPDAKVIHHRLVRKAAFEQYRSVLSWSCGRQKWTKRYAAPEPSAQEPSSAGG